MKNKITLNDVRTKRMRFTLDEDDQKLIQTQLFSNEIEIEQKEEQDLIDQILIEQQTDFANIQTFPLQCIRNNHNSKEQLFEKEEQEIFQMENELERENHLNQRIEQLIDIIVSTELTEDQKEMQQRNIFQYFKKKRWFDICSIFNQKALQIIQQHLDNCTKRSQIVLLQIIEHVVDHCGLFIFCNFHNSGLFEKIKRLLIEKVDELVNSNNFQYSESIQQLLNIYLKMINQNKIDVLMKVIDNKFFSILNQIKNQQNAQNIEISNSIDEQELKSIITTIQEFDQLRFRFNDEIFCIFEKQFNRQIMPLIHLNCSQELKCPFHISIPESDTVQDLQAVVINALIISPLSCHFNVSFVKEHNILNHITSLVTSYSNNNSFHNNNEDQQQQQQSFPSLQILSAALKFLNNLLEYNQSNCNTASNTPNIISSLFNLINFKYNITNIDDVINVEQFINQQNELFAIKQIEYHNIKCITQLLINSHIETLYQFSSSGYIHAITLSIAIDNDKCSNLNRIYNILMNIKQYIDLIVNEQEYFQDNQFYLEISHIPHQHIFFKEILEQMEEISSIEQIDAHSFNNRFWIYNNEQVNQFFKTIFNFFS